MREDKGREASDGYDGAWVAHPDLVPVVQEVFDAVLGERPHQKERRREDVAVGRRELLDVAVPERPDHDAGVRSDVTVALQYLEAWLRGSGAVAINNMMEDTATAEIARAQLWQWIRHGVRTEDGELVTLERVRGLLRDETSRLESGSDRRSPPGRGGGTARLPGERGRVPGISDDRRRTSGWTERRIRRERYEWKKERPKSLLSLGRLGSNQQPPG